jgi:hypothetical protein
MHSEGESSPSEDSSDDDERSEEETEAYAFNGQTFSTYQEFVDAKRLRNNNYLVELGLLPSKHSQESPQSERGKRRKRLKTKLPKADSPDPPSLPLRRSPRIAEHSSPVYPKRRGKFLVPFSTSLPTEHKEDRAVRYGLKKLTPEEIGNLLISLIGIPSANHSNSDIATDSDTPSTDAPQNGLSVATHSENTGCMIGDAPAKDLTCRSTDSQQISTVTPVKTDQSTASMVPATAGDGVPAPVTRRYGTTSMTAEEIGHEVFTLHKKRKAVYFNQLPFKDLRLDLSAGHFPENAGKVVQCAMPDCPARVKSRCCICRVHLCSMKCMKPWHTVDIL